MHRTADSEVNGKQLMRIVALLFSFAALADRIACLPLPLRVAVMVFLRPAESVASEFVAGLSAVSQPGRGPSGDDADSAARLADRFRALAAVLAALAAGLSAASQAMPGVSPALVSRKAAETPRARLTCLFPLPQPFDTS